MEFLVSSWGSHFLVLKYKYCFSKQVWKEANLEESFDLLETTFLVQTNEMGQLLEKTVSHQNEPHRAKLGFSVEFGGKLTKTLLFKE